MKAKTFAIITDIHSNLESLKTSLEIINKHQNIDARVFQYQIRNQRETSHRIE